MLKRIQVELYSIFEFACSAIPGSVGFFIRSAFYKMSLGKQGRSFRIGTLSRIQRPEAVFVGNDVAINDGAWIAANVNGAEIYIGDLTIIGPRCLIHAGNHKFEDLLVPIRYQGFESKPIKIGSGVWIAANVTILSGVTIGDGAVVAAGSVVVKDIESLAIVAGVPAKQIGSRKDRSP